MGIRTFCLLVLALGARSAASGPQPPSELARPAPLSQIVAKAVIPSTTFLHALVQVGRLSNRCLGVVLNKRSSAQANVPSINAEGIRISDLIRKVLESANGFGLAEKAGCIVIAPVADKPRYLKTIIPLFRTPRTAIEMQSYYLTQVLSATAPQPVPKGAWGSVSSVSSSDDSPQIGPLDLSRKSVEEILCILARKAGSTMWIAFPMNEAESQPWDFAYYRESTVISNTGLNLIIDRLP